MTYYDIINNNGSLLQVRRSLIISQYSTVISIRFKIRNEVYAFK